MNHSKFTMLTIGILCALSAAMAEDKPGIQKEDKPHRVIFELTGDSLEQWTGALNNIENLQKSLGAEKTQIELVAHSKGIAFLKSDNAQLKERMLRLSQTGVVFAACENSMKKNNLTKSDILPFSVIVDAGVAELVKKQEAGWSYIKSGG